MAAWLWVSDLTGSDNDWMETVSFSLRPAKDADFVIVPGRLRSQIMRWMIQGRAKDVILAVGPLREYHFLEAIPTSMTSDGNSDRVALGINYATVTVVYAGEP